MNQETNTSIPFNLSSISNLNYNIQNQNFNDIQNQNDNRVYTISVQVNSDKFEDNDDEQNNWLDQLCAYFPVVGEQLSQLTLWQKKNFTNDLLAIYEKFTPCNTVTTGKYPKKFNLEQIILNALCQFKTNPMIMSKQFPEDDCGEVIELENRYDLISKQFISFFLSSIQQHLLQLINFHKTRVEPEVGLKIGSRATPVKRSFQEMKATNCKKVLLGQELKQAQYKKKITKIYMGENGQFKEFKTNRSKK